MRGADEMMPETYTIGAIITMLTTAIIWLVKTNKEQAKAADERIVKIEAACTTREAAHLARYDQLLDKLLEAANLLEKSAKRVSR